MRTDISLGPLCLRSLAINLNVNKQLHHLVSDLLAFWYYDEQTCCGPFAKSRVVAEAKGMDRLLNSAFALGGKHNQIFVFSFWLRRIKSDSGKEIN